MSEAGQVGSAISGEHTATSTGSHCWSSIVATGQCGPGWPDLLVSLTSGDPGFYVTPSSSPKPQLHMGKDFCLFYSIVTPACKHSIDYCLNE